jgi:predicted aldo/keto reductase-like oxidoreductase
LRYRVLGQTGLEVSILGFGGIPIGNLEGRVPRDGRTGEKEAAGVINRALDLGVNFVHTSVTYGDSAWKIGKIMKERRDDCYLAIKMQTRNKTKKETEDLLRKSLEALNTDHIEIAELPVNAEVFPEAMGPDGAHEALREAKEEGIIDYIGITSHDADFLTEAIHTKAFSNLITPFNYAANKAKDKLLTLAAELDMGVIAMKTLGRGGLPEVEKALRYVWGHDIDTAIVGMNKISQVEHLVTIADDPKKLTTEEERQLEKIAEEIIKAGRLSGSGAVS